MMQVRELRIGNYLKNDGVVVKIDARSIFDIWGGNLITRIKKYEPILITESWLLKFGAVGCGGNRFYLDIKDTLQLFWNIGDDYFICGFSSRSTHVCYFNEIKYVHQLQNLYFALTQKELTLNE